MTVTERQTVSHAMTENSSCQGLEGGGNGRLLMNGLKAQLCKVSSRDLLIVNNTVFYTEKNDVGRSHIKCSYHNKIDLKNKILK